MLNESYYRALWEKYKTVHTLPIEFNEKCSYLTLKIIIERYRRKLPLHINFQKFENLLNSIWQQLFIELANDIYCNAADFPPLNIGDRVRSRTAIRVGTPKPRFLDFKITRIQKNKYTLENKKFSFNWDKSFTELVEKFIPINRGAQNETLTGFTSFFEKLNGKSVHDFAPTYFDKKSVFIAKKTLWDDLYSKNRIPSVYLPNPREEGSSHETKSIPALPDCIMYFTTRYEVCYQKLLLQGKNINTIVICNTEEDKMQQILQDRNRFGFNLIILSNAIDPIRNNQIPCWNWLKEEVEIVNSL